ncbi:nSTAND1 domain-containing NTPase [Parachitinimonas caeni]|uniref:Winged helix-turn-helix domain-containing protein n=1 Tax=Parachitinimonas caeni TaxID=3031301 RepID=A0ABT7DW30_9NEIS|nr:winged helix-turn-helix domain-containing protein [Parachitinimonas caeni]MDK2123370.1 winged helix-turn-helix domain-containing protein [Parachitinimonas caeni]
MKRESFRFGDWTVSPQTNCLSNGETLRQVEPKLMDVLVVLCGHPGEVISAERLVQECWGSAEVGDNPLHKTITHLRRMLGDSATAPRYIETIRKRGYRAIAPIVLADSGVALATAVSWTHGSPFRGLQAFEEIHAPIFFGRSTAIGALLQGLSQQLAAGRALQLVLGPSGCGKTSLVRAGLLPVLMQEAGAFGMRVVSSSLLDLADLGEQDLHLSLAGAMLDWECEGSPLFAGSSAASLAERLQADVTSETLALRWALARQPANPSRPYCLLFVDHFEALFQTACSPSQQLAFVATLDQLARSGQVLVILACRNAFYPQLAQLPLLLEGKAGGAHFDLAPPSAAEIAQIIRLPAAAARLSFDVEGSSQTRLDDVLCEGAAHNPDLLPLLQYTLQELYQQRSPSGQLTFAAYHALGGIEGAVGSRAEQLMATLTPAQRGALPRVLSLLIRISADDDSVSSRRAAWQSLQSEDERVLVEALIKNRLLISELVGQERGFRLAQEALLRRWPRLTEWIDEHRSDLRIRARLALQTNRWLAEARSTDLLLPAGKPLAEARYLQAQGRFSLTTDELALIRASTGRQQRRRRIKRAIVGVIVVLAVLSVVLGLQAMQSARIASQHRAEAENLLGYMVGDFAEKLRPLGRLDLLDSVSRKALDYLASSSRAGLGQTALLQRAKALQGIGEVKVARADKAAAKAAFDAALAILENLLASQPPSPEVLKQLGIVWFWQGQLALQGNDARTAEAAFLRYLDYSQQRSQLQPDEVDGWIEQSYAHNSLGSLYLKRGHVERAQAGFNASVDLKTRALAARPDNATLQADLADSLSWLASARQATGQLDAAEHLYRREQQLLTRLMQAAPEAALWQQRLAQSLQRAAAVRLAQGVEPAARSDLQRAMQLLDAVIQREPDNRNWQRARIYAELEWQRLALYRGELEPARAGLQQALDQLLGLIQQDPGRQDWRRLLAAVQQRQAQVLLGLRKPGEALTLASEAQVQLESMHRRNPADTRTQMVLADTLLTIADAHRQAGGLDAAQRVCQQVTALLQPSAPPSRNFQLLDPWVRAHACLGANQPAAAARQYLAQIGYRDKFYLSGLAAAAR